MDQNFETIFFGIGLILIGFLLILYFISIINTTKTSERIKAFVLEDRASSKNQVFTVNSLKFTDSFLRRLIVPLIKKIVDFLGKTTPSKGIDEVNRQLALAGFNSMKAQQYYGIRFLLLVPGLIWTFYDYFNGPDIKRLMINAAIILFLFILPTLWLRLKAQKRQDNIKKSLADALDILAISTAAGLGFDQALLKVGQTFNSASGQEFSRVVSEIEIGVSRQDALRNFSDRVRIPEISSFVAVIIQSELLGMSIADVLRTQADHMRIQRQYWAKEMAQKLPVKMMVPLAFLILPALMAVLLGPMIPPILEIF